jgi:hypothetical protein
MEVWARAFALLQQGTKQRLTGLDQLQVIGVARPRRVPQAAARAFAHPRSAHRQAALQSRASMPARLPLDGNRIHPYAPQDYARDNPVNREQLSGLLDVSGGLLTDNNYKVGGPLAGT